MKKFIILGLAVFFLFLTACKPNLIVRTANIDFVAKTVSFTEGNIGKMAAGAHLTYIEINQVGVAVSATPQSQYSLQVPIIPAGGSWSSGAIPLMGFSSPRGLDLTSLTAANLVVRADAKDTVKETNENDNVYNANH